MTSNKPLPKPPDSLRIRTLADLHLSNEHSDFCNYDGDGIASRLMHQIAVAEEAVSDKHGEFDCFVFLGDMVKRRSGMSPHELWALRRVTEAWGKRRAILLPGNHDYCGKRATGSWNVLTTSEWFNRSLGGNLTLCSHPELVKLGMAGTLPVYGAFIPFLASRAALIQAIADTETGIQQTPGPAVFILFTHGFFEGSTVGLSSFAPSSPLSLGMFNTSLYAAGVFGDVHKQQAVGPGLRFWYVGSPLQLDRGEAEDPPKGALDLLVHSDGTVTFEPVPLSAPVYRTVVVNDKAQLKEVSTARAKGDFITADIPHGRDDLAQAVLSLGAVPRVRPPEDVEEAPPRLEGITATSPVRVIVGAYFDTHPDLRGLEAKQLLAVVNSVTDGVGDVPAPVGGGPLEILRVEADNFMSYERLDQSLDALGVVLILGDNQDDPTRVSNGAGKSAIVEALFYCLFGRTLRGLPVEKTIRQGGKGSMVRVTCRIAGGKTLVVSRGRKHKTVANGLSLDLDGTPIECTGTAGQRQLETLIGFDAALFAQTALFGQQADKRFAAGTGGDRRAMLDPLSGGDRFVPYYKEADRLLQEAQARVRQDRARLEPETQALARTEEQHCGLRDRATRHEDDCKAAIRAIELQWAGAQDRAAQFDDERDKAVADLLARRDRAEADLHTLEANLVEISARVTNAPTPNPDLPPAIEAQRQNVREREEEEREAKQAFDKAVGQMELVTRRRNIIHEQAEGVCPTCLQSVTKASKTAAMKVCSTEVRVAETAVKEAETAWHRLSGALRVCREDLALLEDAARDEDLARQALLRARQEADGLEREAQRIRATMTDLVAQAEGKRTATNPYSSEVERIERQLTEARKPVPNPWVEEAEKVSKAIVDQRARIEELEAGVKALEEFVPYLEYAKWLFSNGGLKAYLFELLLPRLNEMAGEALRVLSDGAITARAFIQPGATRQEVALAVKNVYGADTYEGGSGGERASVDFAYFWALACMQIQGGGINLIVADEFGNDVDSRASTRIVSLFKDFFPGRGTILVLMKADEAPDGFDRVWVARKRNRISTLEV